MNVRMTRFEYMQERARLDTKTPKLSMQQAMTLLKRQVRSQLKKDGLLSTEPRFEFHWTYGDLEHGGAQGMVKAGSRGEARGLIKKALGIAQKLRLPQAVNIVRVDTHANLPSAAFKAA